MLIDKAIEILEDLLTSDPQWPPDDRIDAVKLGIEALRAIPKAREGNYAAFKRPLPGEEAKR